MASRTNETRELSASSLQAASDCITFTRDRLALLSDLFEGDGFARTDDFQLSRHGADAVSQMLVEMLDRLEQAVELLKADGVRVGAE